MILDLKNVKNENIGNRNDLLLNQVFFISCFDNIILIKFLTAIKKLFNSLLLIIKIVNVTNY